VGVGVFTAGVALLVCANQLIAWATRGLKKAPKRQIKNLQPLSVGYRQPKKDPKTSLFQGASLFQAFLCTTKAENASQRVFWERTNFWVLKTRS
jgi:hypothetical protein